VLEAELGKRRRRLTDDQRRRLAAKAAVLGRELLSRVATIVTPDTILRWHRQLIAAKLAYPAKRRLGRLQDAQTFELKAGGYRLPDLVDRAAAFLGRNVIWNESERAAADGQLTVRISQGMALDANDCEDVISELLHTRNFAVVPLNEEHGLYEVIFLLGPRRGDVAARAMHRSPEAILARPNLHMVVVTTVTLQHIHANSAATALRPFISQSSTPLSSPMIGSPGDDRSLVVQGFGPQVAQTLRMLVAIDQPKPEHPEGESSSLSRAIDRLSKRVARLEYQVGLREKD
jgi:hypothetical protein